MKYFVTGATGFLGGRLARRLREAGHEVVALVRDPARARELAALGVRLAPGDVTDRDSMREPMKGVDGVFHVAGWYKVGVRDRSAAVPVNVEGTRNVLRLMQELGTSRGVYTSTLAVNSDTGGRIVDESFRFAGTHLSEYDRTKAIAHDLAMSFAADGLPLVVVQPGMIYGPGDQGPTHDLFVEYLGRRLPMLPRHLAFCLAHVDDVARGHVLAMEKGRAGESYFLCGPIHTAIEVITLAEDITGVPAPRLTVPPRVLKVLSALIAPIETIVPIPPSYSAEYLRVSAGTTYIGTHAKASRELDWWPRPLREGLPEALESEMSARRAALAVAAKSAR